MERPTCKTCPYWERYDDTDPDIDDGICHRFPPSFAGSGRQSREWESIGTGHWGGHQVETCNKQWCGEHPDFPAYIASLKAEKTKAEMASGELPDPRKTVFPDGMKPATGVQS